MARYSEDIVDQFGAPIAGVSVYVYDQNEALAALTQDGGGALANPVTSDQYGGFYFNADDGIYSLEYRYGGRKILVDQAVQVGEGLPLPDAILAALADNGAALVYNEGSEADEVEQSVAKILNAEPLTLERFGGGPDKTAIENSAAAAKITDLFNLSLTRGKVVLRGGPYLLASRWVLPENCYHLEIEGQGGAYRSILQQTGIDEHVIAVPTGAKCHSVAVRNLELRGPGWDEGTARSAHGFYLPDVLHVDLADAFNLIFEDVWCRELSGCGIRIGARGFTVSMDRVHVDEVGDHGIYGGNNTWRLSSCYVHSLHKRGGEAETGAGYRFPSGQVTMIACNGVDAGSGDYWGDFGTKNGEDGGTEDTYAFVNLFGCNIEDFEKTGIRLRNGILNIDATTTFTIAAGKTGKALDLRSQNGKGVLANPEVFGVKAGGAWTNGVPVHTRGVNNPPFGMVIGGANTAETLPFRCDDGNTYSMPIMRADLIAALTWCYTIRNLKVSNILEAAAGVKVAGNQIIGTRGAAVADVAGGATVDAEARAAINALLARLRAATGHGLIA